MEIKNVPSGWYAIALTGELKKGKILAIKRFSIDFVLWRNTQGVPVVMHDLCPHRSVKLSKGTLSENCIECPFHGFKFDEKGECVWIPELKKGGAGIQAKNFLTHEAHGFIWIHVGQNLNNTRPEWFKDVSDVSCSATFKKTVPCNITRAIENQLDFAHLRFVHRKTIGRFAVFEDYPNFVLNEKEIKFYFGEKTENPPSMIYYKFPNIWLNKISEKLSISLVFCPVDENETLLYLTTFQKIMNVPLLDKVFTWLMNLSNRYVLEEDNQIVATHPRGASLETAEKEKLLLSDTPVRHFRKLWSKQV